MLVAGADSKTTIFCLFVFCLFVLSCFWFALFFFLCIRSAPRRCKAHAESGGRVRGQSSNHVSIQLLLMGSDQGDKQFMYLVLKIFSSICNSIVMSFGNLVLSENTTWLPFYNIVHNYLRYHIEFFGNFSGVYFW